MALITLGMLLVIAVLGIAGTSDCRDAERGRELSREIHAYAVARAKESAPVAVVDGELQYVSIEGRPE